jgi:hypothetical protein
MNEQKLLKYLNKQLDETIAEIKWCENHPNPQTEIEIRELNFIKKWLEIQIDNVLIN